MATAFGGNMSQRNIDQFLRACQSPAQLDLRATGPSGQGSGQFSAAQPFALIGRDRVNDLCLDDPQISQRHVYVQMISGRLFCVDMGSRTGIRCAGVQGTSGWLHPGQDLELGPFAVRYATDAAPTPVAGVNPLEARGTDVQLLPAVTLEFANGLTRQPRWRLNRILTLAGRATSCKLQLADVTVSRYHAAFVAAPQGLWVVDLLGKDGTRVNGERVRWTMLEDGDRVQLGKFLIRVWQEGPTTGSNPAVVVSGPTGSHPGVRLPAAVSAGESPLTPLVDQLQRLQLHSYDEFHQSMLLMLQMFNMLQRERLAPVRDDLDQVYRLTRELQNLHGPAPSETGAATPVHEGATPTAGVIQRMTALRQERQSRWHKVLDAVAGEA
jgi:pSer/pThr/pTyr-binding forkhead associated (FHA) protein